MRPVAQPNYQQSSYQQPAYPQPTAPATQQGRRATRAEVKDKVFIPGLMMLILNGLGALGVIIAAGIIMLQSSLLEAGGGGDVGMDFQIALLAFLAVSFFFQAYVAYGGYELMNVRNYNTCFMAAILSILCTGQCLGMLAGIWALIVLNQKEVKSAMSLGSTKRFRR